MSMPALEPSSVRPSTDRYQNLPASRGEYDFLSMLVYIAARRRVVLATMVSSFLLGIILCLVLPVRYTAATRIMPPQQTQPATALLMNQLAGSGAGGALSAVAAKQFGIKNQNDIYIGLLGSRPVADAIIQRFQLQAVYRSRDMTATRLALAGNTTIVSEKLGFIAVSVTDSSKTRAAAIANTYMERLGILMKALAITEASQRRLFYEEQLKSAKDALITGEVALEQVQQKKGLISLDAQAKAMIESLAVIRAQIAGKEVELESLRSYSTNHNPEVQAVQRQLSALQEEAHDAENRNSSSSHSGLSLEDVPSAGLAYLRAEHEVKYRQAMFDLLMKQYDAARLDEAQEAAVIQVVEVALAPDRKSSPHRLVILLTSAVLGLVFGCLAALFPMGREILAKNLRQARLIQQTMRFPPSPGSEVL